MFLISDRNKGKTGISYKICFNPVFLFYYFYHYYNCCDHRHHYFYFEHYCYMFVSFLCSFLFSAKQRLLKDGKKEIMMLLYVGELASVYKISVYYFLSSQLVHLLISSYYFFSFYRMWRCYVSFPVSLYVLPKQTSSTTK